MKATLECIECMVKQSLRAAQRATDDPGLQRRIIDGVAEAVPGMDLDISPAVLSMVAYELSREIGNNDDPYRDIKREQNAAALALEAELRALVRQSGDPLETALHLSAAGNIIDVGALHADDIDIQGAIEQAMRERFAVDHSAAFRASLAACGDLVFLLDNAGEIVFDKILIEELLHHTAVTAVVKGGPIINDVLMEDAEQVGLTAVCEVIDNGGALIGSPPDQVPPSFLERLRRANVIVGKGHGNYETMDEFPGDVFLILRAKCEVVARHMGIQCGQLGLISTRLRRSGHPETWR